jgi:BirA family transcriptional regulator, biotin operon repressor / biotin---[acetyl-CoA-carboxylase] ligase
LRARLAGSPLGDPLIYLPVIGSTNNYAADLAQGGARDGTLVLTDEQPEGRGRVGRRWRSMPRQQLLLSLVLRPAFPAHFLVMAAALAVVEAVEAVARVAVEIKWPNDVLYDGRKLCGILVETGTGDAGPHAILGIGLNVNGSLGGDQELGATATTVASAAGNPISREKLAAALITQLAALYGALTGGGAAAQAALREAWRARLVTLGRVVRIAQGDTVIEGTAEDVDDGGALLLRLPGGVLRTILWGDVS